MPQRKISSQDFALYFKELGVKIDIIVTKKVAPRAVDRNRIKRLIKEALRHLSFKDGLKVIVKRNIAGAKEPEVQTKIAQLLKFK